MIYNIVHRAIKSIRKHIHKIYNTLRVSPLNLSQLVVTEEYF